MKLIIHHPEKQTTKQRWMLGMVTAVFWIFWIYLWIPFVSLLAWLFGIHIFEYEMIERGGYHGLLDLLGTYALVILLLGSCLIGWAVYNIRRFGQSTERRNSPHVAVDLQARHFNVDVRQLEQWRTMQRLVIDHDENSAITSVRAS